MKIRLIAVGTRMPGWITEGYQEYARRMPRETELQLVEIPATPRKGQNAQRVRQHEADKMLARISPREWVVALDTKGVACSTEQLAKKLDSWRMQGSDVVLLLGGADGLAPACHERANEIMSLSKFTFPHALVRIIVAEQLYRAWTLLTGHPYHRA
ncbi:MAG: 23S rRNA (pseudouridine(1915)-N(3))-methyltransferase RlmH [Gammaproteobacteria bacterium]|nr:MAG: 23S rRNA (pseudouridine(1915)-N(3))-methyltransferase RlmH [Gammaproteobacteria bacterium]